MNTISRSGIRAASEFIDDFSIDDNEYEPCTHYSEDLAGGNTACVFSRGDVVELELKLSGTGSNNRVFLSHGVSGRLSIGFEGSDSTVFIGRDTYVADLHIGSRQNQDLIAIGNDVATTGPGRWISGLRSGVSCPAIIVGDACVIAREVTLRNTDGHPILSTDLETQLNSPSTDLLIEPHCWIGERAAILKNVRVGAFSIIGFGAVVVESVPRHHTAKGNPAVASANRRGVWSWDDSEEGLARARKYLERFPVS